MQRGTTIASPTATVRAGAIVAARRFTRFATTVRVARGRARSRLSVVYAALAARRRRRGALLVLLSMSILLAACGARVGPYTGAGAGVGQSGSGAGATQGTTGGGGAAGQGGAAAGGPAGGAAGGNTAGAPLPPPSGFNFDPKSEAAACPTSAGNTSSAPGVTNNAVSLGNVSGMTGPLSGSFPQGPEGVQAAFAAVNGAGGICGRKLNLNVEDDQQDTSTNSSDVQDLSSKSLAFVGSLSDGDNGGVPTMSQQKIPDFGFAINCARSEMPTYYSVAGGSCLQPQGAGGPYYIADSIFRLAQSSGYLPKKVAFLAYNIPISAQAAQQFEYVYTHDFGGDACYTDFSISPATASLESDVSQMKSKQCQGVVTTLDVTGNAKLLQAMQQQSFTLPYTYTTFDGYTPDQITTAGQSAAQGLTVGLPFIPLNEPNPAVQLYQQELRQFEPGKQASGFGFLDWMAAQLFIYSLIGAGHNPTRDALTKVVSGVQGWNDEGATGPYAPASHSAYPCQVDVQVKGNDFSRRAPASGLFCGGQSVRAS